MTDLGNWVVNYLANSAWQVPLVFLVATIANRLVLRLGCKAQHSVWVATLILAVVFPAWSASNIRFPIASLAFGHSKHSLLAASPDPQSSVSPAALQLSPMLFNVLLLAYLTSIFLAITFLLWRLRTTLLLGRSTEPAVIPAEAERLWSRSSGAFSMERSRLVFSTRVAGPVTLGWPNSLLIVPPTFFSEWDPDDVVAAVAHECAHIERRDFLLNLIYQVTALPVAFHPVTSLVKSRIAETRELICDEIAAGRVAGPIPYARSLLRIAGSVYARPTAATADAVGMFDANVLEKRIMTLMERKQSLSRKLKCGVLASLTILLGLTCCAAHAFTTTVASQESGLSQTMTGPENSSQKVYRVGGEIKPPKVISSVDPEYPAEARKGRKKVTGTCVLSLVVDETGKPQQVHVTRSLGPAFDANSIEAVKKWQFAPATLKGQPVPVAISVEISFKFY